MVQWGLWLTIKFIGSQPNLTLSKYHHHFFLKGIEKRKLAWNMTFQMVKKNKYDVNKSARGLILFLWQPTSSNNTSHLGWSGRQSFGLPLTKNPRVFLQFSLARRGFSSWFLGSHGPGRRAQPHSCLRQTWSHREDPSDPVIGNIEWVNYIYARLPISEQLLVERGQEMYLIGVQLPLRLEPLRPIARQLGYPTIRQTRIQLGTSHTLMETMKS